MSRTGKPCGHATETRVAGCRVCELFATRNDYWALWSAAVTPVDSDPRGCVHLGPRVDRPGQVRAWHACGHPDRPLGNPVCPCNGCGPRCSGYAPDED